MLFGCCIVLVMLFVFSTVSMFASVSSSEASVSRFWFVDGGCLLKVTPSRIYDASASSCLRMPSVIVASATPHGPCLDEGCTMLRAAQPRPPSQAFLLYSCLLACVMFGICVYEANMCLCFCCSKDDLLCIGLWHALVC